MKGPDFQEGIKAFQEKRSPRFPDPELAPRTAADNRDPSLA